MARDKERYQEICLRIYEVPTEQVQYQKKAEELYSLEIPGGP